MCECMSECVCVRVCVCVCVLLYQNKHFFCLLIMVCIM